MTPQEIDFNRRFCAAAGIFWHEQSEKCETDCTCGKHYLLWSTLQDHLKANNNPNFSSDPVAVIRVMREQEDWPEFNDIIGFSSDYAVYSYIYTDYILDDSSPCKVGVGAVKWMEGK